jgi:hypothetical protein
VAGVVGAGLTLLLMGGLAWGVRRRGSRADEPEREKTEV